MPQYVVDFILVDLKPLSSCLFILFSLGSDFSSVKIPHRTERASVSLKWHILFEVCQCQT